MIEYGWNQCFYGIKDEEGFNQTLFNPSNPEWEVEIVNNRLKLKS